MRMMRALSTLSALSGLAMARASELGAQVQMIPTIFSDKHRSTKYLRHTRASKVWGANRGDMREDGRAPTRRRSQAEVIEIRREYQARGYSRRKAMKLIREERSR